MPTATASHPTRSADSASVKHQVQELIYEGLLALNEKRWTDFLALCAPATFVYSIVNYSPEIRREQCWMERDFQSLKSLITLLPRHNSDNSQLTRHATVYRVQHDCEADTAKAVTQVSIFRTQLDGVNSHVESGATSLFAVGRYLDEIEFGSGAPRLAKRVVRLDTRQVDIGSHFPL